MTFLIRYVMKKYTCLRRLTWPSLTKRVIKLISIESDVLMLRSRVSGVGRAGRRTALLEHLHSAARLHLPAALPQDILRRTV